ncbi:hypothetical protein BVC80_8723g19 [Macleaya cordata]|uniref:Uncharacterized protein n=1 Tax=Macleaya cordata TaxID=56857 RepID=A0A200Q8Q6_MACCD|nr:hypothetical protein BVC80_8723g19 [Macleaya cordata]
MAPTAAMLILSMNNNNCKSTTQPPQTAFQVNVSAAGKMLFPGLFPQPRTTETQGPTDQVQQPKQSQQPSSAPSLDKRFQEAVELSCWSS